MLGRGCRSNGVAAGCLYTFEFKPQMQIDIWQQLEAKESNYMQGAEILKLL